MIRQPEKGWGETRESVKLRGELRSNQWMFYEWRMARPREVRRRARLKASTFPPSMKGPKSGLAATEIERPFLSVLRGTDGQLRHLLSGGDWSVVIASAAFS